MIDVFGRSYDLPEVLQPCPQCRRGSLCWDGKAWRCNATRTSRDIDGNATVRRSCRRGFALGGLFAEPNAEGQFQTGRVNLRALRLTAEVLSLLEQGVIRFSWATPEYIRKQRECAESDDDRLEFHRVRAAMQQRPAYRKGGL